LAGKNPFFHADHLREFLCRKTIAALPELKQALGTTVDATVFRKLKELSWSLQAVWFSRWGNLVETLETLVHGAPQGYFAHALQRVLHVEVKDALLQVGSAALAWRRLSACQRTASA